MPLPAGAGIFILATICRPFLGVKWPCLKQTTHICQMHSSLSSWC